MSTNDRYAIRGGIEGRARLTLLTRIFAGSTGKLLDAAGIAPGAQCLDAGCGGGDVTRELARRAGPGGKVVGIDMDKDKLAIAIREAAAEGLAIEYRNADVMTPLPEPYDVVYMRFLLSHVRDPAAVVSNAREALRPGGTVIVEDVDFSGHFSHPESAAIARYVDIYSTVVRGRGGDPDIGRKLPGFLASAGFEDLHIEVLNPAATNDRLKLLTPVTMEAITPAAVADGIVTREQARDLVEALYAEARDPAVLTSLPRIVQCWARRPAADI
ncbi:methyltransferase domain-containing protein [Iodidimonas sp. SYSU 1G8]|uniref:methyltransferase domain-containing protein n=1 Tax=Iodidimonas sp. SYSU 1G8 TaxID=3133967 RepID=UPI0031FE9874